MTRATDASTSIDYATFGSPGASRVVVVLRDGATATEDPDPGVTATHDVRILAIRLGLHQLDDPGAYGGETPAEGTASALVRLIAEQAGGRAIGLVGVGVAGAVSVAVAATRRVGVDRLALVAVPDPETPLDRTIAAELMATVQAPCLILNGREDPDAAADAAEWHRESLPDARVELIAVDRPRDSRLSLDDVWTRVLSHTAPDTLHHS